MRPDRWRSIASVSAFGSALAATALVILFHYLGWSYVFARFPQAMTSPSWIRVIAWVSVYGVIALFVIAVSPLPQTPALIFFGTVRHDYLAVFAAMFAGKLIKYGIFTWATSRFPERFGDGVRGIFRAKRNAGP
jgi:membrane protein YqaA with SNARE-associated domain